MRLFPRSMMKTRNHAMHIIAVLVVVVCVVTMVVQPASAQNTYVITDGNQVITHQTYSSDPRQVLTEAGFSLEEDDIYTTQVTTDGVSEITVQRAQSITIDNCGQIMEVNSYGETVGALLERMGVKTEGNYRVSVSLTSETFDGMQIQVAHTVQNEETYTVEVPYTVSYCQDPSLPEGEEKVLSEGVNGQALCKAHVVYENTREVSRTVVEETILQQPVNKVVAVGTGEHVGQKNDKPLIGDGVIVLPTGEVLTYTRAEKFMATAYTKTDEGCDETTSTGSQVHPGVVAVDPTVIAYGTRMFIVTDDGAYIYGLSTAEDCGAAIQGRRLDLYFDTDPECWEFGYRSATVYFLGGANWR